jgi:hypothetical protein
MISLSDAARKELDAFFSGNPDAKKIRPRFSRSRRMLWSDAVHGSR